MKTILVIEDNAAICENACEILEQEGYRAIFALNGKEGIGLAKQNRPDLILCDIMMPGEDGFEVFDALRKDPETVQIPFIFLTASVEKKEIEAGLGMGAKAFILKPFEDKDFFGTIARCLTADPK